MGFPKTGSTTIQKFCNTNRLSLLKNGICYPKPLASSLGYVQHDHNSCCNQQTYFDDWRRARYTYYKEMKDSGCSLNILSSELLAYENTASLEYWKDKFNVRLLYYFRNIFDYLSSLLKELVKFGFKKSIKEFEASRNFRILGAMYYQIKLFGEQNCAFHNFDKVRRQGNLMEDFQRAVGIGEPAQYEPVKDANRSLPDAATNFLYQLLPLPLSNKEYIGLTKDLYKIDLSEYRDFRSNLLPRSMYKLDEYTRQAIKYQSLLLDDADWPEWTFDRMEKQMATPYRDLPPDMQHFIFANLSDESKQTIWKVLPEAGRGKAGFLPAAAEWALNI